MFWFVFVALMIYLQGFFAASLAGWARYGGSARPTKEQTLAVFKSWYGFVGLVQGKYD